MKATVRLRGGSVLRVIGPAKIRVKEGSIMIQGAVFERSDEIEISKYRSYGVKCLDDAVIDVDVGTGGALEEPLSGEEVVEEWYRASEQLVLGKCRVVMVLGPTDSGKSSLVAFIANRAIMRGYKVGIIDADVGQSDIGPPTTVSAAIPQRPILWLRELEPLLIRFIGSITPQKVEWKIVTAIVDLYWRLKEHGVDMVLIDSDGWFSELKSIEYKLEALRLLGGGSIVVLPGTQPEAKRDLLAIIERARPGNCDIMKLRTPIIRRIRRREERRILRAEAYRKYFSRCIKQQVSLDSVSTSGFYPLALSQYKTSHPELYKLVGEDLGGLLISSSAIYIVLKEQAPREKLAKIVEVIGDKAKIVTSDKLKGLLLALHDESGIERALAILTDIDLEKHLIEICTPNPLNKITHIVFSNIRLGPDYKEEVI
ncbi:MAG: Clp1/GlmU family protein [Pyrodictiaceae archaeon]